MIGLYFGGKQFQSKFGNDYGNVEIDAVTDESHEWMADVTSNPVENGAPIADHIIEQADKVTLRCFVSDTPINLSQSVSGLVNTSAVGNRTQTIFDLLSELIKLKQTMSVYTKHRIYENMALTAVTIPRSPGVGEALEFTAEFIHVRKVETQIVDVPKGISKSRDAKAGGKNGATAKKSEPKKDGGKKQPEEVKPTSQLYRIFN